MSDPALSDLAQMQLSALGGNTMQSPDLALTFFPQNVVHKYYAYSIHAKNDPGIKQIPQERMCTEKHSCSVPQGGATEQPEAFSLMVTTDHCASVPQQSD